MTDVLLDSHAFLWLIVDDPQLSKAARDTIRDPSNQLFLSVASVWEIAIKHSLGRLSFAAPMEQVVGREMRQNGIQALDVRFAHATRVAALPFHHRDPFDRLLAAQCLVEGCPLLSRDVVFDAYGVPRLW